MSLTRVTSFAVSLDGFGTGEGQALEAPFGHAGVRLVQSFFGTRLFAEMQGTGGGRRDLDDALMRAGWDGSIGAEIMGRGKFGPQTGPWDDESWRGWWGEEPPFGTPVFVLTHHPRPPLVTGDGTVFTFLDASPAEALGVAREAAGGRDVRIGGGVQTVRQFLAADLVDHMHIVVVPIILGRGERLWDGLEGIEERFTVESVSVPSGVTHMFFRRKE